MKKRDKLLSCIIALVLMLVVTVTPKVQATSGLSQQEIFESIVKLENGFYYNEDIELKQEHYDNVEKVSTAFEYAVDGWDSQPKILYLDDWSYLEQLNNLKTLSIHIPTEVNNFKYDIEYLNKLPFERLVLGINLNEDLSQNEILNIQKNQVTIIENLNSINMIEVFVDKFGMLDNDFLLGLDLRPNIVYLKTIDQEVNMYNIAVPYSYSHNDNGVNYYKATVNNPFKKNLTLDEVGIITIDTALKDTEWDISIYDETTPLPDFYNKKGEFIVGDDNYYSYSAFGVDSMIVYFSEAQLEKMIQEYTDRLKYLGDSITDKYNEIYQTEEDLLIETDPEKIVYLKDYINWLEDTIELLEEEILVIKESNSSEETNIADFSIWQNGVDDTGNHSFETGQRFFANIVLEAEDYKAHTVTFESNGGTRIPELREVEDNSKIAQPTDPQKGEIDFLGWYKDEQLEEAWDFENDTVTKDITLYAKWDEIIHTVEFNSNGGSRVDSQSVLENTAATKPTDPIYSGHTFKGWYIEETLETKYDFSILVTKDTTLYAKWEKIPTYYTVSFDSKGGSTVNSQSVLENTAATKPTDPIYSGHTFKGWYIEETLETKYDFSTLVTEDTTLYAKWETNSEPIPVNPEKPNDNVDTLPSTGVGNGVIYLSIGTIVTGAMLCVVDYLKKKASSDDL